MKKLLMAGVMIVSMVHCALAAQWTWHGAVRTQAGHYEMDTDKDYIGGPNLDSTIGATVRDDSGTFINLVGNSILGTRADVSPHLTGAVELGLTNAALQGGDEQYDAEGVYLRSIYGKYRLGPATLMLGKYYTPSTYLLFSTMTADLGDMGEALFLSTAIPYAGRRAQVRFYMAGVDLALVEHAVLNDTKMTPLEDYDDADFSMPKIELAYQWNSPLLSLRPMAGYQVYEVENNLSSDTKTITSLLYGLGVNLHLGSSKINMTAARCTNPDQYGIKNITFPYAGIGSARLVDGELEDAQLLQSSFVINYKINERLKVEGGYGYIKAEQKVAENSERELESTIWYANLPIYIGSNMELTPEVGALNRGEVKENGDKVENGKLGTMEWVSLRLAISF